MELFGFRFGRTSEPGDCRWCGIAKHGHHQQYDQRVGWHTWEPPTGDQVKGRMLARRAVKAGEQCCELHNPGHCCDPEDCGPCCPECPECPTLKRMREART